MTYTYVSPEAQEMIACFSPLSYEAQIAMLREKQSILLSSCERMSQDEDKYSDAIAHVTAHIWTLKSVVEEMVAPGEYGFFGPLFAIKTERECGDACYDFPSVWGVYMTPITGQCIQDAQDAS